MGRAMLIICSGLIIALGYTIIGTNNQAQRLTNINVGYANQMQAQNAAQIAVQVGIEKINEDPDWVDNHASNSTAWSDTIIGANTNLWIEKVSEITNDSGLKEVTFRIHSSASYFDQDASVTSLYEKSELHYVPEFKSVLSFTGGSFTFVMADSATINGSDSMGSCEDLPGIVTSSSSDSSDIASNSNSGQIQGNPAIKVDESTSYSSYGELVEYLEAMSEVKHLSGNYSGTLGDSTSPGVYFVDSPVDIQSEISNGYGILIIQDDGKLYYQGNTDIADKLTFNGLVIFEDAWDFKADNTPSIAGSVVLGNTGSAPTLDIVLDGSISISFDCDAQKYARQASALIFDQDGFRRIVTFE